MWYFGEYSYERGVEFGSDISQVYLLTFDASPVFILTHKFPQPWIIISLHPAPSSIQKLSLFPRQRP